MTLPAFSWELLIITSLDAYGRYLKLVTVMNDAHLKLAWDKGSTDIMYVSIEYPSLLNNQAISITYVDIIA